MNGNEAARVILNLVKSTRPRQFGDLVVQAQVRGYPAVNCGVAMREGFNAVYFSVCHSSLVINTRFGGATSSLPEIEGMVNRGFLPSSLPVFLFVFFFF